ncbi:MAG: transposase [Limnothrix sp. CACIAM 69d]|nr:MAG: transposase [Limnothrix sp. CACIAM 69d]
MYFLTLCTQHREPWLGQILDGKFDPTEDGRIAIAAWQSLPQRFPNIRLDAFVAMPNHIHGILEIVDKSPRVGRGGGQEEMAVGAGRGGGQEEMVVGAGRGDPAPTVTGLGNVVAYFKYQTTKTINQKAGQTGRRIWQRNYWERVVRHDDELTNFRNYIVTNPQCWNHDRLNPHT